MRRQTKKKMSPVLATRVLASIFLLLLAAPMTSLGEESELTNAKVVALADSGLADSVIIAKIRSSDTDFDLSTEALLDLQEAGLSEAVLQEMLNTEESQGSGGEGNREYQLPESYGFYWVPESAEPEELALSQIRVVIGLRLKGSGNMPGQAVDGFRGAPPQETDDEAVELIIYEKGVDPSKDYTLRPLVYVDKVKAAYFNTEGTLPSFLPRLYGREADDVIAVDLWRPAPEPVSFETVPTPGTPDMYRLIPKDPLEPGRYALYRSGAITDHGYVYTTDSTRAGRGVYFGVSALSSKEAGMGTPPPGVAIDRRTNLMWTRNDNGVDIDWHAANTYCEELSLEGFSDWKVPAIDELESLFDENVEADECGRHECQIRLEIDLTGPDVWSSTRKGRLIPRAFRMSFRFGHRAGYPLNATDHDGLRVLCVRASGR